MFTTIRNAFKIPELRRKLLISLFIIVLYRFGAVIPVPYIHSEVLEDTFSAYAAQGNILAYMNILSGEAFSKATLFALSISPYITASIVMQLLTIAIPPLERLSKSGEEGQKKITQITRIVTVALGLVTAIGYYILMRNYGAVTDTSFFTAVVIIACYSAGAALIMWMSEKINEHGIGNGISLILFANIVASAPTIIGYFWSVLTNTALRSWRFVIVEAIVVIAVAIVVFVVFITNSERRLPVQYAKKVVGRKMYGGQNSTLPIKLNMTGVMPIIFSSSIVSLPSTIIAFFNPSTDSFWYKVERFFSYNSPVYAILFFLLIIAFNYFYVAISFNPVEVANNLKKNGGFIPGIRPGKPTSDYISKVLGRITLIGALFLGFIAVFPIIVNMVSGSSLGSVAFGGSSLLIVVGVALETVRELEAQMTMRHYKGFLE